jgi:TrmH family RNA methyltransferase
VIVKNRTQAGLTIIDGIREIRRAADAGVQFKELFLCRDILGDFDNFDLVKKFLLIRKPIYETTLPVFKKISYGDRNEGVVAVCAQPKNKLTDIDCKKDSIIVVVEGIEKPGNLGAIFRSCDGAGVDALILCDSRTDLYNPNVIRASLGTVFTVKSAVASNEEALHFLKKNKSKVCATVVDAKKVYFNEDFKSNVAIVVGSEDAGLSKFWIHNADAKLSIPMKGKADSLNVSSTAAVMIYEVIRQKYK